MKTKEFGTKWGGSESEKYDAAKHGPDGKKFLDPWLYRALSPDAIKDKITLDLGTGTGPWAKYLADNGAKKVLALDSNQAMLNKAKEKKLPATLLQADAGQLPIKDNTIEMETSINVGCNLPSLDKHLKEAYRVCKEGGELIITAPDSLLQPFTNGKIQPENIQQVIDKLWAMEKEKTIKTAKATINKLEGVLRATFILETDNKPTLITKKNEKLMTPGKPIIRRIPGLVVDNVYHDYKEYILATKNAGWTITEEHRDSFSSQEELKTYNSTCQPDQQLGPEYINNPAFLVLKLTKQIL